MKIRVFIDGNWSAMDFAEFFAAVSAIYYFPQAPGQVELEWSAGDKPLQWTSDGRPLVWTTETTQENALGVDKIVFGSPGFAYFTGLGAALKEIRLLIQYLCERRRHVNHIDLQNQEQSIRNEAMRAMLDQYSIGRKKTETAERIRGSAVPTSLLELISKQKIVDAADAPRDDQ